MQSSSSNSHKSSIRGHDSIQLRFPRDRFHLSLHGIHRSKLSRLCLWYRPLAKVLCQEFHDIWFHWRKCSSCAGSCSSYVAKDMHHVQRCSHVQSYRFLQWWLQDVLLHDLRPRLLLQFGKLCAISRGLHLSVQELTCLQAFKNVDLVHQLLHSLALVNHQAPLVSL